MLRFVCVALLLANVGSWTTSGAQQIPLFVSPASYTGICMPGRCTGSRVDARQGVSMWPSRLIFGGSLAEEGFFLPRSSGVTCLTMAAGGRGKVGAAPKKGGKKSSTSSKRWLNEHVNDKWVKDAQKDGYRSRAAYKLLQVLFRIVLVLSCLPVWSTRIL